jgi:hypothetical protein
MFGKERRMFRIALGLSLLTLLGAAAPYASAQVPDGRPDPELFRSTPERLATATTLAKSIPFAGIRDRKTTLCGALETLGLRYGLTFDIAYRDFLWEDVKDVLKTEVATVPIPEMKQTSLDVVLRTILARIPVSSRATYLIQSDGSIRICTRRGVAELYREYLRIFSWYPESWWLQIKYSVQEQELDLSLIVNPAHDTGVVLATLAEFRRGLIDRVGPARTGVRP